MENLELLNIQNQINELCQTSHCHYGCISLKDNIGVSNVVDDIYHNCLFSTLAASSKILSFTVPEEQPKQEKTIPWKNIAICASIITLIGGFIWVYRKRKNN